MEIEHFSHPDHPLILINQVRGKRNQADEDMWIWRRERERIECLCSKRKTSEEINTKSKSK
jgi:hypothetical protein